MVRGEYLERLGGQRDAAMLGPERYERQSDDFYPTIEADWIVPLLLKFTNPPGDIWEPACGAGHLSRVLEGAGYRVHSTDLVDRGFGQPGMDFLETQRMPEGCRSIITNPPYQRVLIDRFVAHALDLTRASGGFLALLVRNEFDAAVSRLWMTQECPSFARKIVLTKRPRWFEPEPGEKSAGPRHNYAWLVWDWSSNEAPTISWGGPNDV